MALVPALMMLGMLLLAALCCSALSDGVWLFVLLLLVAAVLRTVFLLRARILRARRPRAVPRWVQKTRLVRRG